MKPQWNPGMRPAPVSTVYDVNLDIARIESDHSRKMTAHSSIELKMFNWKAFENMKMGHGSDNALELVVSALNIALALCEMGFGEEWIPTINLALSWAFRAKVRGDRTGKWGFDGPAIKAITDALEVHDLQMEHASKAELLAAIDIVRERVAEGNVYRAEPAEK